MTIINTGTKNHLDQERAAAIARAKTVIATGDFIVLDFETTGFNGEPVQVAAIDQDGVVIESTLVKPMTWEIEKGASDVHGIDKHSVANAPTWTEVWTNGLWLHLDLQRVVAYNAAFERKILDIVTRQYELDPARIIWEDPMIEYARFNGAWNAYHKSFTWQKLGDACKTMKVKVDGDAHDALVDVRMTLELIKAMAKAKP